MQISSGGSSTVISVRRAGNGQSHPILRRFRRKSEGRVYSGAGSKLNKRRKEISGVCVVDCFCYHLDCMTEWFVLEQILHRSSCGGQSEFTAFEASGIADFSAAH